MILNEDEMNAQEVQPIQSVDYKALYQEFLDSEQVVTKQGDYYVYKIYADYNDTIEPRQARELLSNENPDEAFDDLFDSETYIYAEQDLFDAFHDFLRNKSIDEPDRDTEWELKDMGNISYEMDYDHYFDQIYKARIIVDTGDGDYDFTLNPSYYNNYQGENGETDDYKIGKPASLAWLAETQGYSVEQLQAALADGDLKDPKGFLQSVRQEAVNVSSSMNAVTFLVKATLKQMMTWKQSKCPITVPANCRCCGLYDAWNGGGSILEIELEKPVTIPAEYIREFNVDEDGDGMYSVDGVYGLSGEAYNTEVSLANSTNEALNEAEMKMNAQGRMRPTTYKSHLAHKSSKPLSLQVYDGLVKLGYAVYASFGRYGYRVSKYKVEGKTREESGYKFIKDESILDKAKDLCNNLKVDFDVKKNYDGTFELLTKFIDDSDEVDKYFKSTDRVMKEGIDDVEDVDLDKLIQDITAKCHEHQIGLQDIWKDGLFIDAIVEGDWKHDHWCFEDLVKQIYPKVRISQQKVWSTGEDFYKAQYSIFAHPLIDDFAKLFGSIDESLLLETGEWEDNEEGLAWKQGLLKLITDYTDIKLDLDDIKGFDMYQGPYAYDSGLEFWTDAEDETALLMHDLSYNGTSGWYSIRSKEDFEAFKNNTLQPLQENLSETYDEANSIMNHLITWLDKHPVSKFKSYDEFEVFCANEILDKEIKDLSYDEFSAIDRLSDDWIEELDESLNESVQKSAFNKLDGKSVEEINQLIDEYQDAVAYEHDNDPNLIIIDCASSETEEKIARKFGISGYDYCDSPVDHEIYIHKNKQAVLDKFYEVNDFGFDSNLVDVEHIDNRSVSYRFNGKFDVWSIDDIKTESLEEDIESTEIISDIPITENVENNGLAFIVNNLIQDEWQAIQGYKDALASFEAEGRTDLTQILKDALDEENIHVGQLQTLLQQIDSSAEKIAEGETEAEQQLVLDSQTIETVNDGSIVG